MKTLIPIILFFSFFQLLKAQDEFITVWKPSNIQTNAIVAPAQSTSSQVWLPTRGSNYKIDWEEIGYPSHNGSLQSVNSLHQVLIDFGAPHNPNVQNTSYRIKISNGAGSLNQIRFGDKDSQNNPILYGDTQKLITIENWGNVEWVSMEEAFRQCSKMNVTATDIPDFSQLTKLSFMFMSCNMLEGNATFNDWDVSTVTNLEGVFTGCALFNQPIGNWDVSNVTTMAMLFNLAKKFNQPLATWDVSSVTEMTAMFSSAEKFNQPLGNWNTSNVKDMEFMFSSAKVFNQPIGNWNTSSVEEMDRMFNNALVFNQDISNWNTQNVYEMSGMFAGTQNFNQNISNWDTANVENMSYMFQNALSFNQNISNWNTSKVNYMSNMFNGAVHFNHNLGSWNLSALTQAYSMFLNAGLNCQNYDSTLYGWSINPATPSNINLVNASPLIYTHPAAVTARNYLINTKGWTITGDSYDDKCESALSVSEASLTNEISIYPNPVSDSIFVKNIQDVESYKVFDTSGRLVLKGNFSARDIGVRTLPKGNYILQIKTKNNVKNLKFIKK